MIEYPKKKSEAEFQAEIWYRLRKQGIDARLQVKADHCRLDIVIFRGGIARGIIECKSWSKRYVQVQRYQRFKNQKQFKKYQDTFHLPIFVCGCKASIEPAIRFGTRL